jgi:hypothetical protein
MPAAGLALSAAALLLRPVAELYFTQITSYVSNILITLSRFPAVFYCTDYLVVDGRAKVKAESKG